jgi:Iron/zinc purple acid phosphatase-like protein C
VYITIGDGGNIEGLAAKYVLNLPNWLFIQKNNYAVFSLFVNNTV